MKTWLTSGLLGLLVGITLAVIYFFNSCYRLLNHCGLGDAWSGQTCGNFVFCILPAIALILLGLIIGATIGLIIQKIKSKQGESK